MPRRPADPSVPTFTFELNPEKSQLSQTTLTIYRNNLNKITAASHEQRLKDKRKKPILTKTDLLKNPARVIAIINSLTETRATKCAMYSAVFYAVGKKNLLRNKKMSVLVEAFRSVYNDEGYTAYKAKKQSEDQVDESS
jgi:hypothetical protein